MSEKVSMCIIVVIMVMLLWGCTGCGTLTGVIDDSQDIITHARTHVK